MKKTDKIKKEIIDTFNESMDRCFNDEYYNIMKKVAKEQLKKKKQLEKLAETYLIYSCIPKDIDDELMKTYKRLGYYEIIKDCMQMLRETDSDIKLGFCGNVNTKEILKKDKENKNNDH